MGVKNRLKDIRMREFAMNQKEFAEYLDVGNTTYCGWETGASKPTLETAIEIADKLNKDVKEIWYLEK